MLSLYTNRKNEFRSGGPMLKQTQTYPAEFGREVKKLHTQFIVASQTHDTVTVTCLIFSGEEVLL
jgi:hypothetical protein